MSVDELADSNYLELPYTNKFYTTLSPATLDFAAHLRQRQMPQHGGKFNYLEFGCGNGYNTNLLAACYPSAQFIANDFVPSHIQTARRLAERAGLGNVRFLEKSFKDLLGEQLPEFDYIVMHGIYTWVGEENRQIIRDIVAKHLKPGGLLYVSYNCLSGNSDLLALRRVLQHAVASHGTENIEQRIQKAFETLSFLDDKQLPFHAKYPQLLDKLEFLKGEELEYVAHEMLATSWDLFDVVDVSDFWSPLGLQYIGHAHLPDNFPHYRMPQKLVELLDQHQRSPFAEVLVDLAMAESFRRDVYQKDSIPLQGQQHAAQCCATRFALNFPRATMSLSLRLPVGTANLPGNIFNPILDAVSLLRSGNVNQIEKLARERGLPDMVTAVEFMEALESLVAFGFILPLPLYEDEGAVQSTTRFNNTLLQDGPKGKNKHFASPVLGNGFEVPTIFESLVSSRVEQEVNYQNMAYDRLAENQIDILDENGQAYSNGTKARRGFDNYANAFEQYQLEFYRNLGLFT